jgi:hypothetical protein
VVEMYRWKVVKLKQHRLRVVEKLKQHRLRVVEKLQLKEVKVEVESLSSKQTPKLTYQNQ